MLYCAKKWVVKLNGCLQNNYREREERMKKWMDKIDDKYDRFNLPQKFLCWVCILYLTYYFITKTMAFLSLLV